MNAKFSIINKLCCKVIKNNYLQSCKQSDQLNFTSTAFSIKLLKLRLRLPRYLNSSLISNEAYWLSENKFTLVTHLASFVTSSGINDWPFFAREVKVSYRCCNLSYRSDLPPLIPRLLQSLLLVAILNHYGNIVWGTWFNPLLTRELLINISSNTHHFTAK